jgi:predicted transcriptional regulator
MGEGDPLYRAAHLGLEQWNNIPADPRIRLSYHDQSDKERELACSKAVSFLFNLMAEYLTTRQFEVMRLYHLEFHLTQNAVGQLLGIAQSTVNQHLNGKRRGGKNVGGAYRRIRRQVCRIAEAPDLTAEDRQIVGFLMSLSQSDILSKKRRRLFWSLQ